MLIRRYSLFFENYFVLLQSGTDLRTKVQIIFDMQMKKWNNYLLMVCIAALLAICVASIYRPAQTSNATDESISDTTAYNKNR